MLPTTASLLEQSLWWLVPYAVLILLMVYAMMECTVTLLQRPPAHRKSVAGAELRRRLLALNAPDQPHPLVVGQDCDLEMRWQHEDFQRSRFVLSRHSSSSHVRFLLDEQRHELRMHQVDSGSGFFLGHLDPLKSVKRGEGTVLTDHIWTFRELLTAKCKPLEFQRMS